MADAKKGGKKFNRESGDDPRRPALDKRFFIAPMEEDALGGYSQAATTAGLFLGLMGLLLKLLSSSSSFCVQPLTVAVVYKMRILAWGSLLAVVAGLANIPRAELDIKQILSSVMIAVMGLVMAYLSPQQPKASQ
ncbi:uncharacterized protein ACA1_106280 [Acanthamoeba castellanii str. Neff]|uniref:Uncharacterized protein n=1 Tax=Acanthamoeba castellanii (strain ATCC 30010 / Neff) TaxID=1257118 RepID=L8GMT0_ACACF|nr:uncharacterized protein ACA1_106280 [Acanthamoeba castellanii str. Neff]ELR14287.1 hypothetical protein ACA1_106280 [Acanthamoeba castellanii str. Neff]